MCIRPFLVFTEETAVSHSYDNINNFFYIFSMKFIVSNAGQSLRFAVQLKLYVFTVKRQDKDEAI